MASPASPLHGGGIAALDPPLHGGEDGEPMLPLEDFKVELSAFWVKSCHRIVEHHMLGWRGTQPKASMRWSLIPYLAWCRPGLCCWILQLFLIGGSESRTHLCRIFIFDQGTPPVGRCLFFSCRIHLKSTCWESFDNSHPF